MFPAMREPRARMKISAGSHANEDEEEEEEEKKRGEQDRAKCQGERSRKDDVFVVQVHGIASFEQH